MEMERFEAAQRRMAAKRLQERKLETDANYKRMVDEAMKPENIAAVRLGVASHNLFDLSYALVQAAEKELLDKVQFEMLEGMARAATAGSRPRLTRSSVLLYAPVCNKQDFIHAIRLSRAAFRTKTPARRTFFARRFASSRAVLIRESSLAEGFIVAREASATVSDEPRRTQNRLLPPSPANAVGNGWQHLINEPDTDFSSTAQRRMGEADHRRIGNCDAAGKATEVPLDYRRRRGLQRSRPCVGASTRRGQPSSWADTAKLAPKTSIEPWPAP